MIFFFRKCKGDHDERPLRIIITTATPDNHSITQVQRSNTPIYRTALVGLIAAVLFFILCHSPNVLVEFLSLLARFFLKVCELYMKIIIRILYNFFALFE